MWDVGCQSQMVSLSVPLSLSLSPCTAVWCGNPLGFVLIIVIHRSLLLDYILSRLPPYKPARCPFLSRFLLCLPEYIV